MDPAYRAYRRKQIEMMRAAKAIPSDEEGLNQIAMWQTGMYNPQVDMKEALGAQLEKKDPEFEDLYPIKKGFGLL